MKKTTNKPSPAGLEALSEKEQEFRKKSNRSANNGTIYVLVVIAIIALSASTLWFPVLRIHGNSMAPTLTAGETICSVKTADIQQGDIISFNQNNKILVKRVIALSGDWVDINENGTVSVNNEKLEEPYLNVRALGYCNIELPYQVPEGKVFVMGDHRSTSVDSRNTAVGCVSQKQIIGKILFCVWPLNHFGIVR